MCEIVKRGYIKVEANESDDEPDIFIEGYHFKSVSQVEGGKLAVKDLIKRLENINFDTIRINELS